MTPATEQTKVRPATDPNLTSRNPNSDLVPTSGQQDPPPPKMSAHLLRLVTDGSLEDLEKHLTGQSSPSPYVVTDEGDSMLHVVATFGEDFDKDIDKAKLILGKAKDLLFVQNTKGDTPLHCAIKAQHIDLVTNLIDFAKEQNRADELLQMRNKHKYSVLSLAVRSACHSASYPIVRLLVKECPELLRVPKTEASPLYYAIRGSNKAIAETLHQSDGFLSYSGEDGENALHAAVQCNNDLTKMVLGWDIDLALQGDNKGHTPLHNAVVNHHAEKRYICSTIMKANPDSVYQRDQKGMFPIHMAAMVGAKGMIIDILKNSRSCAGFRDATGRTFLHVAVNFGQTSTVHYICGQRSLRWVLNMQDEEGNTALHLAVKRGSIGMFSILFAASSLQLDLTNNNGETVLDISRHTRDVKNTIAPMLFILILVGANGGIGPRPYLEEDGNINASSRADKYEKTVKEGTQSLIIVSVLVMTLTFAAAFAVPGGFKADDHKGGGSPTLGGVYAFDAFTMANALAFAFSMMATIGLTFSGSPVLDLKIRGMHLHMAGYLMRLSAVCVAAAFATGSSAVLATVCPYSTQWISALCVLAVAYQHANTEWPIAYWALCRRMGSRWVLTRIGWVILGLIAVVVVTYWPMLLMFGLPLGNHIKA